MARTATGSTAAMRDPKVRHGKRSRDSGKTVKLSPNTTLLTSSVGKTLRI